MRYKTGIEQKWEQLRERMLALGIREEDLLEKFILGSGRGGQNLHKTSSCVYLQHLPSQQIVKCQKSRSRELNRLYARRELCDQIEETLLGSKSAKQKKIAKQRKQKLRRSRRSRQPSTPLNAKHRPLKKEAVTNHLHPASSSKRQPPNAPPLSDGENLV